MMGEMRGRVRSHGTARAHALVVALALGGVLVGCAAPAQSEPKLEADPMMADMGAETFARHCAACHGAEGRGDGPVAASLSKPPADLTRIAARRGGDFPRGELGKIIDGRFAISAHGTREMPVWGARFGESIPDPGLSEEIGRGKIAILLEYLASIQVE